MKLNSRNRIVDFAVGAFALGIYVATLAPTITWRNNGADSGDLVSAAFTLGIPHPTGYPLFTILAAIFSYLPIGEPAKNVNAFSALVSAGTISLFSMAGRRLFRDPNSLAQWISPCFALVLAFAPAFWSQATIAEVNALAIFLATALFAVLLSDSPRRLFFAAAIFGIGLTHHLTIVLLAPAAIFLLGTSRWSLSQFIWSLLILIAPLALYLYLPLRASTHPPVNWGDPETLDGFLWVVSGAPYRPYLFTLTPSEVFARFALTARFLFDQFTVVGVGLGLWGAAQMGMRSDAITRKRFVGFLLAFALPIVYAIFYASHDSFVYLLPSFLVFLFWMMYGANDLAWHVQSLGEAFAKRQRGAVSGNTLLSKPAFFLGAGVLLLMIFPAYNLAANFNAMNVSSDYAAYDYAKQIFAEVPRQAVVIADGDEHLFALEYYRNIVAPQSEIVVVSAELLQYSWYFDQVRKMVPSVNAAVVTPADRLVEVVDASLAQGRSVYSTVRDVSFSRYAMEARGSYFRVIGRLP